MKCAAQWCIDDGWLEWRACIPIIIYNPFTLDFPPKQSRHDLPSGPPDNVLRTFGKCVLFLRVHPYTGCTTKVGQSFHFRFSAQTIKTWPAIRCAGQCPATQSTQCVLSGSLKMRIISYSTPINSMWVLCGYGHFRFSAKVIMDMTCHPVRWTMSCVPLENVYDFLGTIRTIHSYIIIGGRKVTR